MIVRNTEMPKRISPIGPSRFRRKDSMKKLLLFCCYSDLRFHVDTGFLAEYMTVVATKTKGQVVTASKGSNFCAVRPVYISDPTNKMATE